MGYLLISHHTRFSPVLVLNNVTKNFGTKSVVRQISFNCQHDTRLSILGPSGCGKSTLLRLIVGLEQPDSGSITIAGRPGNQASVVKHVAYLGQRPALLPWLTALDNALLPLRLARPLTPADHRLAEELFKSFGLDGAGGLMPGELSGGMRQRVALVQSLIVGADLLIVDEPFAALDDITRRSIVCQLHGWIRERRIALIMVTHSFEDAAYLSDRVFFWRHSPTITVLPQLHEVTLACTFTPACDLDDFAKPEFAERKSHMFSKYLEVGRNLTA